MSWIDFWLGLDHQQVASVRTICRQEIDARINELRPVASPPPEPGCAKCGDSGIVTDTSGTIGTNCDHASPTDEEVRDVRDEILVAVRTKFNPRAATLLGAAKCLDALLAERAKRATPVDDAALVEEAAEYASNFHSFIGSSQWSKMRDCYLAAARKYARGK